MLGILRRAFSFSDWNQHNPTKPPPGDMLDASFDAQNQRIEELDALVSHLVRPDGELANASVGPDSLKPELARLFEARIAEKALEIVEIARNALREAEKAQKEALETKIEVISAQAHAEIAKNEVLAAKNLFLAQKSALEGQISAFEASTKAVVETRTDWDDSSSAAQAWADSSRLWAEHMPDTLPDNALKIMDVTGDHWSSRWWANQAANAFGMLTSLYLGAHPVPPATNANGGPIQLGSIYYDTTTDTVYVWDGSQWQSFYGVQRAGVMTLWYTASANQTVFPLNVPDLNGLTYTLDVGTPEGLDVHVNGLKAMPDPPSVGRWTVDYSDNAITFKAPGLVAGDRVGIDVLVPNEALGPGDVYNWALKPLLGVDGVKVTFSLECASATGPLVTINRDEELLVSIDGVIQQPSVSYTAAVDEITFMQAPIPDSLVFIVWMRSDGGTGLPAAKDTPDEILDKLLDVDGAGSLLDADFLDGHDTPYFLDWVNFTGKPATYPPSTHGHPQSEITSLVTDLGLKAPLASPVFTGNPVAPTPSPGDADTSVATTAFVSSALTAQATAETRNRVVNPAFQIAQEWLKNTTYGGNGSVIADMWVTNWSNTGAPVYACQLDTTDREVNWYFRLNTGVTVDAAVAVNDYYRIQQYLEGTRVIDFEWCTPNAKPAVLRFRARGSALNTFSVAVRAGGSSFTKNFTFTQVNTWTDFSVAIPGLTAAGTFVTDNTASIQLDFTLMAGTTYTAPSDGVWSAGGFMASPGISNWMAVANQVFDIANVGLYLDPQNTGKAPRWAMPDEAEELRACERYYQRYPNLIQLSGYSSAGDFNHWDKLFPTSMRVAPTCAFFAVTGGNADTMTFDGSTINTATFRFRTVAAGRTYLYYGFALNARM